MNGETVRIGVIGAGDISHYHLSGLQAAGGADVRVISGRRAERVAPVAEQYGIPDIETDYRAVLARDDIDAVMILTPEISHEEIAVAAAEAGKAMMVQKPVAHSVESCKRLIVAAERAGVNLQVSYMHRYFEEVVYARDLIRSGKFGEIHAVRMRNATSGPIMPWYYDPAVVQGGVVFSLGSHGIDLVQHLVGAVEDVSARTATMMRKRTFSNGEIVTDIELEDIAFATYRMKNGILVDHEMSGCEQKGTDRFLVEIYGEKGTMLLRGPRGGSGDLCAGHHRHVGLALAGPCRPAVRRPPSCPLARHRSRHVAGRGVRMGLTRRHARYPGRLRSRRKRRPRQRPIPREGGL